MDDLNIQDIAVMGGGAALGACVGTWVSPGLGSLVGTVIGGLFGYYTSRTSH